MKGNVWLAVFIVVSLVVIGGSGFYAFSQHSGYGERFEGWNNRTATITRLEKKVPSPTQENVDRFEKELSAYEAKVAALFDALNQFQKPLEEIDQTELPNRVKQKVEDFSRLARDKGTTISELEPLFMGMDLYQDILPKQEVTPLLAYQLDAIEQILGHMVNSGVEEIYELNREELPGETNANAEPEPAPGMEQSVVQKYPVQFRFEGTHPAFRSFLNEIANDKEYFFSLRVIRIENSAPDGPTQAAATEIEYRDKDGNDVPREIVQAELGNLIGDELEGKLEELEWTPVVQDATILFGQETLRVFAVIDIVRFLPPSEETDDGAASDENEAP